METQATTLAHDTAIFNLIEKEKERQTHGIELIASENYVSEQVMRAQAPSLPTNTPRACPANATTVAAKL